MTIWGRRLGMVTVNELQIHYTYRGLGSKFGKGLELGLIESEDMTTPWGNKCLGYSVCAP